jgi:hypothetical protein
MIHSSWYLQNSHLLLAVAVTACVLMETHRASDVPACLRCPLQPLQHLRTPLTHTHI